MKNEKKEKIAIFRFGVIFPLVECNVSEYWGEKERILRELVSKDWEIPFSDKTYISKATTQMTCFRGMYPAREAEKAGFLT